MYLIFFAAVGLLLGVVGVASNPSPCFAAMALVVTSGFGCWILAGLGHPFVSLVLLLIYSGGMMVVFAYSISLISVMYPQAWGDRVVGLIGVGYILIVVVVALMGDYYLDIMGVDETSVFMFDSGYGGICMLYAAGSFCFFLLGLGLFITLIVVVEVVRSGAYVARKV